MARDWDDMLGDLQRRRDAARAMGGPERLARQRAGGRLDARARIDALVDPGTFRELGMLVGSVGRHGLPAAPADALVGGIARIDGRSAVVYAEDFTVQGGSIGLGNHAKRVRLAELALQEQVPLVMMLDGAGERATNALERYPYAPNDLQSLAMLSGRVPVVALVMGASAGHGALCGLLADVVVMTRAASMFAAGPALVESAIGETLTKEELGGAETHVGLSGVAHLAVESDAAAIGVARRYLRFFPSSAWQHPPRSEGGDVGPRALNELPDIVPANAARAYDMRRVIGCLVDEGESLELQPDFGSSMLTVLARLGGRSIAIVANQPLVGAGAIDRPGADKATRFLDVADAFGLPVLFLADNPGVMVGSAAERTGALRAAARMYSAARWLRVPKLHLTLRKAFGFGSSMMAMNPFDRQTITLAFPTVSLGAMPAASGSEAARLAAGDRDRLAHEQSEGPWQQADTMAFDDVVDPRDLRGVLLDALALADARRPAAPSPRPYPIRP